MAINVTTQDLENYPGVTKRVTIDQESIIPSGAEGDEKYVLNFSTTAYSDNDNRTSIQDYYITSFKAGWCKSSGFTGTKFALDASNCSLEVKIDNTASGIDNGYYRITLNHSSGVPIDGEVVAADMETKIRDIADTLATADVGYRLAYLNTVVEFTGGRFWIVSGSLSEYYSGDNRSSVKVRAATNGTDCSAILGFDLDVDSEAFDSVAIKEALITNTISGATSSGTVTLSLNQATGASAYECMMITNGTDTEYFQITSVPTTTSVQFNATNLNHTYTANLAKVQLLREQDPDADPALWFDDVDKITRHGVKTMIQQIDYSS